MRQRTKVPRIEYADAIFCSDLHLRETQPVCRTDDFWQAQFDKLLVLIRYYRMQNNAAVVCAGDVFDHWKPSPRLLAETLTHLINIKNPKTNEPYFFTVYGQHDLPQHNMNLAYKSGLNLLNIASAVGTPKEPHKGNFGSHEPAEIRVKERRIGVWHKLIWDSRPPVWDRHGDIAREVLERFPQYDVIVTGDNHKSFVVQHEGRLLVNPGCFTRQTAAEENYCPRFFLYFADANTVVEIILPAAINVISRDHITIRKERDERLRAFITRLNDDWEAGISFEDNLRIFFSQNKISDTVQEIILNAMEEST